MNALKQTKWAPSSCKFVTSPVTHLHNNLGVITPFMTENPMDILSTPILAPMTFDSCLVVMRQYGKARWLRMSVRMSVIEKRGQQ